MEMASAVTSVTPSVLRLILWLTGEEPHETRDVVIVLVALALETGVAILCPYTRMAKQRRMHVCGFTRFQMGREEIHFPVYLPALSLYLRLCMPRRADVCCYGLVVVSRDLFCLLSFLFRAFSKSSPPLWRCCSEPGDLA